jgi:hypothetical protein
MSVEMEQVFLDMKAMLNSQIAQLEEEQQRLRGVLEALDTNLAPTGVAGGAKATSALKVAARGSDKVNGKALQSPVVMAKRTVSPEQRKRISRRMKAYWKEQHREANAR